MGDFNINAFIQDVHFTRINVPTHISGPLLDYFYVKETMLRDMKLEVILKYISFSDHDAVNFKTQYETIAWINNRNLSVSPKKIISYICKKSCCEEWGVCVKGASVVDGGWETSYVTLTSNSFVVFQFRVT